MVKRLVATNANVIELTIAALTLGDEHQAIAQAARSLAAAVDAEPENASLWREYRQLLVELTRVGTGGADDDTQAWVVSIQTPGVRPSVRNVAKS